jgi:hypothetical protein
MAFEFRSIDRGKPAGAKLKLAVKPTQVSAVVHRLVNIQPGSVEQQALIDYRVLYAPADTFYLKMPAALADAGARISGADIKERPRIDKLPDDQRQPPPGGAAASAPAASAPADAGPVKWAYYKIVLQAPVIGSYRLTVDTRRSFQAGEKANTVAVEPILAAGKLSDQIGYIAVVKADTLAIGELTPTNLLPGDPTSATDVPEPSHRALAPTLAFRYNAPPFELSLSVVSQKEAAVFTTIATGAVIEQVLGRDGELNTNATFLLATSRGDRLAVRLPKGAKLFGVLLNGAEAPVEAGSAPEQKIVRLPPSAGQVAKIVLELRYGLKDPSGRRLEAPHLPDEIPVQQTLWRLRIPAEDYLLWFDSVFSRLGSGARGEEQLGNLAAGYPGTVQFKFAKQGQVWDFVRQGPPGDLRICKLGREPFAIAVWAVILIVGAIALKLNGFHRCVLVLAAAVAAIVLRLFAPLLVRQLVLSGLWAGVIVLGLWLAYWLFKLLPRQAAKRADNKRPAAPPTLSPAPAAAPSPPPIPQASSDNQPPAGQDKE